jgi:hypothetical protein
VVEADCLPRLNRHDCRRYSHADLMTRPVRVSVDSVVWLWGLMK